jgi:putative DNA methylase
LALRTFSYLLNDAEQKIVNDVMDHGLSETIARDYAASLRVYLGLAVSKAADKYYAFKQSEVEQEGHQLTGWATFLQAVVEAGYAVVGTWPCVPKWRTA